MIDVFLGALIFSILCVTLFLGKSIGLSMILFVGPFTYYLIYLLKKNKKIENAKAKILIIPILLLASTYFIFNNSFFNDLNRLAIPVLLVLMIMGLFNEKIRINIDYIGKILGVFIIPISFIGETFGKLKKCLQDRVKIDSKNEVLIKKVVKAMIITIPIVFVIIMLLSSADSIFGDIFINILEKIIIAFSKIEVLSVVIKVILIIIAFIYLLCVFDYLISVYKKDEGVADTSFIIKDDFTIKMILTALNIVYLIFCYIQIKSLFLRKVDIDYAQYARQGFFQLMIVSFINLVTILIAKKSEEPNRKNSYISIMSLIMIGFTFIILISSAVRMYFYESAYGYTLLRLLVYCALFTEAILFIPTILYIKGQKINLVKTYFTIILTIYVGMNFMNFDNIIAKRNVDRYIETGKIDMNYIKFETGTDAVKQITRILEVNTNADNVKDDARRYLKNIYDELDETFDIREFNISKVFAQYLIEEKL